MLLAVDIGNTNISCGIFPVISRSGNGSKIINKFDLPTKQYSGNKLLRKLKSLKITDALICSVVPKATKIIAKDLTKIVGARPYIIGKDIQVPIRNLYHKPRQVGQDRLVNAYAACQFYAAPLVVIDSGTAITFDVISRNKAYLGGLITPGMEISLAVLSEKTALLPQIKLHAPGMLIGRDTKNSILSGIVFGTAELCDGLIRRIKQYLGKGTLVIGTGGNICLIKKYSKIHIKIDRDLTLKGINLIYENGIKQDI